MHLISRIAALVVSALFILCVCQGGMSGSLPMSPSTVNQALRSPTYYSLKRPAPEDGVTGNERYFIIDYVVLV